MAWSITEVAQMAGVTSRTLRHYDAIGLLAPAYVGTNGYRYYEEPQLLRLQQFCCFASSGWAWRRSPKSSPVSVTA